MTTRRHSRHRTPHSLPTSWSLSRLGLAGVALALAAGTLAFALAPRRPASTPGDLSPQLSPAPLEPAQVETRAPTCLDSPNEPSTTSLPLQATGNEDDTARSGPSEPAPPLAISWDMLTATAPRMSPPRARSAAPLPAPPKSTPRLFVKRRARRSEAELIDQAARAPALSLDRNADQNESGAALAAASRERATGRTNTDPTLALFDRRADLAGLPFRRGAACRLPPDDAEHLAVCSAALRGHAHDAGILRKKLTRDGPWRRTWRHADAVPALSQALMAEGAEVREVLVEQLASIEGKAATEALAQRALYDLSPRVREEAINALADRPPAEYRPVLLGGFAHPWPPVADHAAEALVALREAGAVPALKALLSRPDPRAPYRRPGRPEVYVKELVRVNHLINCLLCHPPSFSPDDKARGRVPPLDEPLDLSPSGPGPYGLGPGGGGILAMLQKAGTVIRADITYLKQDFSLTLPVARPGIWPREQRFDFLVRERLATARDAQRALARGRAGPSEQHRAALFALHELTTPARR